MLLKWLKRDIDSPPSDSVAPIPGALPIQTPEVLLVSEAPLIKELSQLTGMSSNHWDALYLPLLHAYASFVQRLPASEAHHHAYQGGLLKHSLETAIYALRQSRSNFGSSTTAVEDTARKEHCVKYAIVTAALLHDIAKPVTDQTIELFDAKGQSTGAWNPWQGSMQTTPSVWYLSRYKAQRKYTTHQAANLLVARSIIPEQGLAWLSDNADIFQDWLAAFTSPDKKTQILEAIQKGDQWSTAKDLAGPGGKAVLAKQNTKSLQHQLITAIRHLFDTKHLTLNKQGAAAWIHDGKAWLVAKRVLDAAKQELTTSGVSGIPSNNTRIMDELQAFGILVPNEDGKSIHHVQIEIEDWLQKMTVLCIPVEILWPNKETRPAPMSGAVHTSSNDVQEQAPASAAKRPPKHDASPPFDGPYTVPDEDDPERMPQLPTSKPSSPAPKTRKPTPDPTQAKPKSTRQRSKTHHEEGPELDFARWIKEGLAQGTFKCNTQDAVIHGLEEGLFLVSPIIFKQFASKAMIGWETLQRRVQRREWHQRSADGKNVRKVIVKGERTETKLSGLLIVDAEAFFGNPPPPNPHISLIKEKPVEPETSSKLEVN